MKVAVTVVLCLVIHGYRSLSLAGPNEQPPTTVTDRKADVAPLSLDGILCNPKRWKYDGQYVSIVGQGQYVRGSGKKGILFSHVRSSECLNAASGGINNAAYRPYAEIAFPRMDWSGFNRLSFWIYVEGNAEELFYIGLTRRLPYRVECHRGRWFHARWDYGVEQELNTLRNVTRIYIGGVNQGTPPGDPGRAKFYLSDFKLEKVDYGHYEGWTPDPKEVVLAYTGYYPDEPVQALLAPEHAGKPFVLDGCPFLKGGNVSSVKQTDRTAYTSIDLPAMKKPGHYTLAVKNGPATEFAVSDYPYDDAVLKGLYALDQWRCGIKTAYHGACHLDDGVCEDTGKHYDVSGGWHDEGVCKAPAWTLEITAYLATLRRTIARRKRQAAGKLLKALDTQIEWGARTIPKYELSPGRYAFRFSRPNWYHTDNQPNTKDDRKLDIRELASNFPVKLYWQFVHSYALTAQAVKDRELRDRLASAAKRAWQYRDQMNANYPDHYKALKIVALHLSASIEMYRLTGEREYADDAVRTGNYLVTFQTADPRHPDGLYGYFRSTVDTDSAPFCGTPGGHDNDAPGIALADLVKAFPKHRDAQHWRAALRSYAEGTLKRLARFNRPYGYVASGPHRKPLDDMIPSVKVGDMHVYSLYFKFHTRPRDGRQMYHIQDAEYLEDITTQLAAIGAVLGDRELVSMAHANLRYLFGVNPFHLSVMRDFGARYVTDAQMPCVPGFMVMSTGLSDKGVPFFLQHGSCRHLAGPFAHREGTTHCISRLARACAYLEMAGREYLR